MELALPGQPSGSEDEIAGGEGDRSVELELEVRRPIAVGVCRDDGLVTIELEAQLAGRVENASPSMKVKVWLPSRPSSASSCLRRRY